MCLRRAPEKYIAGAALDRATLKYVLNCEQRFFFRSGLPDNRINYN
jgi:hypothetical protein